MVNESLGLLLDSDVHAGLQWEIAVFSVCGVAALSVIGWLLVDAIQHNRSARKVIRQNIIRLDRHETDLVDKVREGAPYPPLPADPDD